MLRAPPLCSLGVSSVPQEASSLLSSFPWTQAIHTPFRPLPPHSRAGTRGGVCSHCTLP